jgi:uncharacterized membrane protein (UPF0182 family)
MLPAIPAPARVWRSARPFLWLAYAWLVLSAIPALVVRLWFLESLGHPDVFWTNVGAQSVLLILGVLLFGAAVVCPVRHYAVSPVVRRAAVDVGVWIGTLAGWLWSMRYEQYLLALNGQPFGETDPVFGRDLGFHVFVVPAIETSAIVLTALGAAAAVSAIIARLDDVRASGERPWRTVSEIPGLLVTHGLSNALTLVGLGLVSQTFLARYGLLYKDNGDAGVRIGAAYLDVEGVFSTLNLINVSTVVELALMVAVGASLYGIVRVRTRRGFSFARPLALGAAAILIDLSFFLCLVVKQHVFVSPNEPTIQMPFIERHIAATTRGYRLENVTTAEWRPPAEPVAIDRLAASRTVRNAPLMASWVSALEEPPDVQHYERIRTSGSTFVYGPLLQIFQQEQQLRPYYHFISVDGVRYRINGERRMFVSAARELPTPGFAGPREWLRHWGSAALMLTHGMGLVMSPVHEVLPQGGPRYVTDGLPPRPQHPELASEPRIYFGEGAKDDYILTDIEHLKELDYATNQSRQESVHRGAAAGGIVIDSAFKRIVLALYTLDINQFLFSSFIDPDTTRAHFFRTPMQRLRTMAPFLFLESNAYAVAAGGRTLWMMNGLTTTDRYPYSFREVLGDKADERAVEPFPERVVNYAEDAVKITMDAYSGEVRVYQIADDPIVSTWARVYPSLFRPGTAMPEAVRAHLTYPLQWFHIQFDDIYKRYHQKHPVEFYNAEDLWDDADEVVGSLGRGLVEYGTSDEMTFSYEGYNTLIDPADMPSTVSIGAPGDLQFATVMPFTPEGARNLRSLIVALQDPGQYGRLISLRVAQGAFVPGPEQADTLIDNDSQVNQQITLWVRHGSEVVRGHTLLLPVAGDLLYIEPLWIVSLQNPLPQLKLVSVVYRGRTAMGTTLDEALAMLGVPESEEQKANDLPWFNVPVSGER